MGIESLGGRHTQTNAFQPRHTTYIDLCSYGDKKV